MFKRHLINIIRKRFAGRRTTDFIQNRVQSNNDIFWKTIENTDIKSAQDWRNVRNEILNNSGTRGRITQFNIDAMMLGLCTSKKEYDLALSYLDFLEKEQIKPNLATMGKYFKLLYVKGASEQLSKEDEERILMLYDNIRKSYPVLDALTLDNVIQAVSLTNKWKVCLDLLDEVKITASPSAASYNAVIAAAFLSDEDELAWKLFDEMLEQDKTPQDILFSSYFKKLAKNTEKSKTWREIEKMFNFIQRNSLKIDSNSLEDLIELMKKVQINIHSSTVTSRGICKCCKSKLQAFDLTEREFNDLKSKVIQNVIIGKDVFNKSTPDELEKFKNFISNMGSFDVVIDGLNVAYSAGIKQSTLVTSGLVAAVVSHFVSEGKKVLVFGRNHMNRWPKQNWGYVLKNATVFLTQDLSQDDPYLLYCALNSGKNTIIVTKDLMRGHKFLLKNVLLKHLFDRWLAQRQYQLVYVQESGKVIFKKPSIFSDVAQKNEEYWHVPYTDAYQDKNAVSNTWLCIQF